MNNVDLIIKYLSGDMTQKEAGSFEKDLANNSALKEKFEDISVAYKLIKDQLQKRDEDSFREKLVEVMKGSGAKLHAPVQKHRPKWYFLLPLAASLAILLAVYLMSRGTDRILTRFYNPAHDPVVMAFNQATRGETESGISLYQRGQYGKSMEKMSLILEEDSGNTLAILYYLLAAMELDLQEDALEKIRDLPARQDHQLGQSIIWYTSLALIKSEKREEAASHLLPLINQPGPYEKDARQLQKMLLK